MAKKFIINSEAEVKNNLAVTGSITTVGTITANTFSGSVFSGSFVGDGSLISGLTSGTNLSQSVFVSPSGDDGTAEVGNLAKPFQTILAATASANIGDTIIVYPGVYRDASNIIKDGVNYYFYPGSVLEPLTTGSEALIGGGSSYNDGYEYQYPINIRGALDINQSASIMSAVVLNAPSGYAEFGTIRMTKSVNQTYRAGIALQQNRTLNNAGTLYATADIIMDASFTNFIAGLICYDGRVKFDGNITVTKTYSGAINSAKGLWLPNDSIEATVTANIFTTSSNCIEADHRTYNGLNFKGNVECYDQSNYYAIRLSDGYSGGSTFDGTFLGAIYLNGGYLQGSGTSIYGYQQCTNSPSSLGAVQVISGYHVLNHKVQATEDIFYMNATNLSTPSYVIFNGSANIQTDNSGEFFNIVGQASNFIWNGVNGDQNNRANTNTISAGKLTINSPLDHYGSNFPSNQHVFDLSGGILEINNRVSYFQTTTGSGFINMTGGYLKLNSAEFIQDTQTGSFAYTIDLNSGTHSGSFLNNSFSNLTLTGSTGTFVNEAPTGTGNLYYFEGLQ